MVYYNNIVSIYNYIQLYRSLLPDSNNVELPPVDNSLTLKSTLNSIGSKTLSIFLPWQACPYSEFPQLYNLPLSIEYF